MICVQSLGMTMLSQNSLTKELVSFLIQIYGNSHRKVLPVSAKMPVSKLVTVEVKYNSANKAYDAVFSYTVNGYESKMMNQHLLSAPVRGTANAAMLAAALLSLTTIDDKSVCVDIIAPQYVKDAFYSKKPKANIDLVDGLRLHVSRFQQVSFS